MTTLDRHIRQVSGGETATAAAAAAAGDGSVCTRKVVTRRLLATTVHNCSS